MIAFTLCSNNYLSYASVLSSSLKTFNPEYTFVLGLVDELHPKINYARYGFDQVLPVKQIAIPQFDNLRQKYNIVEFNTAVKPFYLEYLLHQNPAAAHILYFDPDIRVYASLQLLYRQFEKYKMLLIPHFSTPHNGQAGIITPEIRILQRGLYNLGFIGLKNDHTTMKMIHWWQERLIDHCFIRPEKGMFVDQKWIDLVPVYFDGVGILKNSGCNVAYWNLYEHEFSIHNGQVCVNNVPLVFYHFSAFAIDDPTFITQLTSRFDKHKGAVIRFLYEQYQQEILKHDYHELMGIPWSYDAGQNQNVRDRQVRLKRAVKAFASALRE